MNPYLVNLQRTRKMIYSNRVRVTLIGLALIALLKSQLCSTSFLPDQLHCESEVFYRDADSKTLSWYQVNEYIDMPGGRSSIKLFNIYEKKTTIYYNQLGPPGGSSRRKFMAYDVDKNTCRSSSISSFPLRKIRRYLISMLPIEELARTTIDVALGPSGLVIGVEHSQDEFLYVKRDFCQVRLTKIDIYERIMDTEHDLKAKDMILLIILRVVSETLPENKMLGTRLVDHMGPTSRIEFSSISICQVSKEALKRRAAGTEYQCDETELIVSVDYYMLTPRMAGSLIGRSLDEMSDFNYEHDPFMRPIGIGCWRDFDFSNQKKFSVPLMQFSAQYITTNGSAGLTYVAYDGYRRLLRLDRDERKSIYDLDRGMSYHANMFHPVREVGDVTAQASKSCVVLKIDDDPALTGANTMERLLGVGPSDRSATHYMGTKMVDHVAYDVFEVELPYDALLDSGVPIFMEATGYVVRSSDYGANNSSSLLRRYFMTYYVHDDRGTIETFGTFRYDDARTTLVSSMSPKFIELWEVVVGQQRRILVNRLEFTDFSWSLEVQPEEDPDGQDLSRLFYIKSCSKSRSTNWQLRFLVSEDTSKLSKTEIAAFSSNKQLIREVIQSELASTLDISRLQIAQLDITFLQRSTVNLFVDARLVELEAGTSEDKMLGYVAFKDIMNKLKDYIRSFNYNRHSLESCKLDSLAQAGLNSFLFCRGLTICVVFKRDAVRTDDLHLDPIEPSDGTSISSNTVLAKCELHQYDWAPRAQSIQNSLRIKMLGIYELNDHPFEIKFSYTELGQLTKFAKFKGYSHDVNAIRLDSVGLEDAQASLVGIRYTTIQEDSKARNMNIPIKLASQKREARFNYCQMACQFDEYCESFSVCIRKQAARSVDCILSTLRLTNDRVEPISEILRKNTTDELEIKESDQKKAQVFRFQRDPECNIHPKDILSNYKVKFTFNVTNLKENKLNKGQKFAEVLSLEDCAGASFENGLQINLINTNFTYCPLSSICLPNKPHELVSSSVGAESQICTIYIRDQEQFYNYRLNTHLSIVVNDGPELSHDKLDQLNVGRTIEGLSTEECARDCNLHRSNCLAFDSCYSKGVTSLCILYSIRSPISFTINKKLGLLPQEKRFYARDNEAGGANKTSSSSAATLVGISACNHYALRGVYFDIKLQQMLDSSTGVIDELPQRDELDKLEDSIIKDDQKRGEEVMNRTREEQAAAAADSSGNSTSGGYRFHFLLFLLGLVLGCFGIIHAGGAPVWVMDSWDRLRVRFSKRHQGHRISQLALANSYDTS